MIDSDNNETHVEVFRNKKSQFSNPMMVLSKMETEPGEGQNIIKIMATATRCTSESTMMVACW